MVLNARSRTTAGRDHISAGEVLELRGSKRIVGMEARGLRAIRVTTTSRQAADESDKPVRFLRSFTSNISGVDCPY